MAACTCNYGRTGWHSAACPMSEERRGGMTPREEIEAQAQAEERDRLAEQVRILREVLNQIRGMAEVRGRWLDDEGTAVEECAHDEGAAPDGATWTPYDLDEQNAAMEAIAERALEALEATKEGA